MNRDKRPAQTVTEAQLQSQYAVIFVGGDANHSSNVRAIPYAEFYHARTGPMDTPFERLQEAAKDDEARKSRGRTSR